MGLEYLPLYTLTPWPTISPKQVVSGKSWHRPGGPHHLMIRHGSRWDERFEGSNMEVTAPLLLRAGERRVFLRSAYGSTSRSAGMPRLLARAGAGQKG